MKGFPHPRRIAWGDLCTRHCSIMFYIYIVIYIYKHVDHQHVIHNAISHYNYSTAPNPAVPWFESDERCLLDPSWHEEFPRTPPRQRLEGLGTC